MARSRDEAWHAVLVAAYRAREHGALTFTAGDVQDVVDDLGLEVADRTLRRTIGTMADFGYLQRVKQGTYQPSRPWVAREYADVDVDAEVADAC